MLKLNNDIQIPQMGAGTWTLKGEVARENVCMALQAGFRHIDTAQMYENEEFTMGSHYDYVERVVNFLRYLSPDIVIQRVIGTIQ